MVKAMRSRLLWAGWVLLLAGCGGGGSGEDAQRQPSVSVAQTEFRYERVGDDTARIEETVSIWLTHLPKDGLFVSHGAVPAFLSRLHFEQPSSTQALLHFRVEAARELDPGLHTGELQLHFCRDEACEQPIAGSPVVLSFSYLVTPPPVQHYPEPEEPADPLARLTPLQLYPLAYEVVDSAFSSAMSSVLLLAAEAEPGLVAYGADGAELTRYTFDQPAQRLRLSNDGTLVLVQSGRSLLQVVALQQANGTSTWADSMRWSISPLPTTAPSTRSGCVTIRQRRCTGCLRMRRAGTGRSSRFSALCSGCTRMASPSLS